MLTNLLLEQTKIHVRLALIEPYHHRTNPTIHIEWPGLVGLVSLLDWLLDLLLVWIQWNPRNKILENSKENFDKNFYLVIGIDVSELKIEQKSNMIFTSIFIITNVFGYDSINFFSKQWEGFHVLNITLPLRHHNVIITSSLRYHLLLSSHEQRQWLQW